MARPWFKPQLHHLPTYLCDLGQVPEPLGTTCKMEAHIPTSQVGGR